MGWWWSGLGSRMRTCSLTKPSHLRECLLVRLRGSRDSWIPPPFLRLVR